MKPQTPEPNTKHHILNNTNRIPTNNNQHTPQPSTPIKHAGSNIKHKLEPDEPQEYKYPTINTDTYRMNCRMKTRQHQNS